ncbi:ketopantoate reductase C-terminal domain-containing protein, partial [Pseudomonas neuropathica]|uniref:ketopantoate reductase family protein n=1 Tax=Pseudomonas neuropathica TaxID=2730425 RepID=UPI0034D401FE
TGATLEQLYSLPELRDLVSSCLHEALLTAAAYGARVSIDPQTFLELGAGMGAVRTSMLQDYEKGRPLELAAIGDAVLGLADCMAI